jgi:hypothetical protein
MNDEIRKFAIRVIPIIILGGFVLLFIRLGNSSRLASGLVTVIGVIGLAALEKGYLKYFNAEYENTNRRPLSFWVAFIAMIGIVLYASVSLAYVSGGQ